jgi:hypothetical protein
MARTTAPATAIQLDHNTLILLSIYHDNDGQKRPGDSAVKSSPGNYWLQLELGAGPK